MKASQRKFDDMAPPNLVIQYIQFLGVQFGKAIN